jgi:Domain of unknown function (DUF4153)
MRLPSFVTLAERVREVVLRFPWTMAAGIATAISAIMGTRSGGQDHWLRIMSVTALGLPLTVALTLFAEERGWSATRKAALNLSGVALLVLFYLAWPGPDQKHEAIRYFQLSAGLHFLVATLPYMGQSETTGFWQYNRRLFLGFLRATVFSAVLYAGLVVALVALDKLFGVDVPSRLYARLYIVVVFVINTGIFLAAVPSELRELANDITYPKVLKVFAQYILTPLVFIYLLMLLAYLVKIVAGGQWPSGWIGWLVTSVSIAGLLGFLLVHPLRDDPGEAWIHTYTRWLFVGLIPAAVMLLVAFWKRVLPYGWTEPRLLGVLLGFWLLGIAVTYTLRPHAGIRRIPLTLGALLLVTLYGPLSVTRLSVSSQSRRLASLVASPLKDERTEVEASAALRFLLEHGSQRQIAAAVPAQLPPIAWDSVVKYDQSREAAARQIMTAANMRYSEKRLSRHDTNVYLYSRPQPVTPITGYDWMLNVSGPGTTPPLLAGSDTVFMVFDTDSDRVRVTVQADTMFFDLGRLAAAHADDFKNTNIPAERMRLDAITGGHRATLAVSYLNGQRKGTVVDVTAWQGMLFLGRNP